MAPFRFFLFFLLAQTIVVSHVNAQGSAKAQSRQPMSRSGRRKNSASKTKTGGKDFKNSLSASRDSSGASSSSGAIVQPKAFDLRSIKLTLPDIEKAKQFINVGAFLSQVSSILTHVSAVSGTTDRLIATSLGLPNAGLCSLMKKTRDLNKCVKGVKEAPRSIGAAVRMVFRPQCMCFVHILIIHSLTYSNGGFC
jgi:hypothetical protein